MSRRSFRSPLGAVALSSLLAAQTGLHTELAAAGLSRPVFVTAPPGDFARLFVVEQQGRIKIVRNGAVLPAPFLNLASNGSVAFGGERGLLGLAFHPAYAQNGQFFVYHNTPPAETAVLRRFTVSAANPDLADPASGTTLLTVPLVYGNHNGGMIAFGPDGYLYVAIGDGGSVGPSWPSDPQNHAQRGDSLLGKILRLDVDQAQAPLAYGIPASNPFAGAGDPRDEIWAFGLRNPWRFSFDRLTGDLWIADVGGLQEEVDFAPAGAPGGANYGWSCMSGTQCHVAGACTCNAPALTLPIHEYATPVNRAIIGGFVYRGAAIPDLRGSYFFADFATSRIWSLRLVNGVVTQFTDRTAELAPPQPYTMAPIASLGQDGRGELYVCDLGGQVWRIVPDAPVITGLAPYGAGVPGCAGSHVLDSDSSPVLGNLAFVLRCSQAPAGGLGFCAVAGAPDVAGSDPFGLGFPLHFQWNAPLLSLQVVSANGSGTGSYPLPIPPVMALAGLPLYAQQAWAWSASQCTPTPLGWSSTHGLQITLQP